VSVGSLPGALPGLPVRKGIRRRRSDSRPYSRRQQILVLRHRQVFWLVLRSAPSRPRGQWRIAELRTLGERRNSQQRVLSQIRTAFPFDSRSAAGPYRKPLPGQRYE